ncbi:hypothetical protein SAMN05444172_2578 [Burkholderia sp. GAS332]|nr:hypothetical protein SAMN05444172_2578 [Burkholderia sp. GAS332]
MQNLIERVPLDVFMPFIMAGCPDLPESMAQAYIRQTCVDFCQRSGWLRRTSHIDQQLDVCDYPVWLDACEQIVRINEVHIDHTSYRGGRDSCCFDHCGARFTVRDGMLHMSDKPQRDKQHAIKVRFISAPTRDACEVDATLHHDWQEAIEDGALAKIYLLPGYRFTSPQLSIVRGKSFSEHVGRARIRALRSETGDATIARAESFV